MDYTLTHVRLMVNDVAASTRFYQTMFGWEPLFKEPDTVYQEFDTGSVRFSLYKMDYMSAAAGTTDKPAPTRRTLYCWGSRWRMWMRRWAIWRRRD